MHTYSQRPVALVGLPGVGKSSIGRYLSRRLDRPFFDTDQAIESSQGRSIAELFKHEGETYFRQLEFEALKRILDGEEMPIVATGGGAVIDVRCRELLRLQAFTIYLRSEPERLVRRLTRNDRRPLFRRGEARATIVSLHAQRDPFYTEVAAITVDVVGRPLHELVEHIAVQALSERPWQK